MQCKLRNIILLSLFMPLIGFAQGEYNDSNDVFLTQQGDKNQALIHIGPKLSVSYVGVSQAGNNNRNFMHIGSPVFLWANQSQRGNSNNIESYIGLDGSSYSSDANAFVTGSRNSVNFFVGVDGGGTEYSLAFLDVWNGNDNEVIVHQGVGQGSFSGSTVWLNVPRGFNSPSADHNQILVKQGYDGGYVDESSVFLYGLSGSNNEMNVDQGVHGSVLKSRIFFDLDLNDGMAKVKQGFNGDVVSTSAAIIQEEYSNSSSIIQGVDGSAEYSDALIRQIGEDHSAVIMQGVKGDVYEHQAEINQEGNSLWATKD